MCALHEDLCTFMMVSHSVLKMRNISFENCTENRNIHLMFSNFSQKSCHLTDNMEKYNRARQATDDWLQYGACALHNGW
jgi:hypothetical protein